MRSGIVASPSSLQVNGIDLVRAIHAVVGAQRRGNKIVLSFENGQLRISRATVTVSVPAAGTWPDQAVIGPRLLRTVIKMKEPLPETVELRGQGKFIHLAFYKIRCEWVTVE